MVDQTRICNAPLRRLDMTTVLLGMMLICVDAAAALVPIGDVSSVVSSASALEMRMSSGALVRFDAVDAKLIRVRVAIGGTLSTTISPALAPTGLTSPPVNVADLGEYWYFGTPDLQIFVHKRPFAVIAVDRAFNLLSYDSNPAVMWDTTTGNLMTQRYALPEEHYFGLGLRGGPIDRRGRNIVMRNTDQLAYTESSDPLYQSYPYYYAVRNGLTHGVFVDNPQYPFFSMNGDGRGMVLFGATAQELNFYIIAGPTPLDVAQTYAKLTGYNPIPPKWSLGYQHSHYGWLSASEVLTIAQQFRANDFPGDALWFDIDYMDRKRKFTWSSSGFPQPEALHLQLNTLGFKTGYIDEPCIRTDDPLWAYLDARGFFVKSTTGGSRVSTIWFGDVSWFDFTNSTAAAWYAEQAPGFLSRGVDAVWNDLNEPAENFMPDAVFDFDGGKRTELESRNLYALYVNKTSYASQAALRPNIRPWNMSRAGYPGIQRYASTWSGDGNSDFATLKVNIQMSVSMGLSGQNQFGHDSGGFLGSPSGELYVRWLEFSSFTPLFRTHSINTAAPREPWSFGEPYTSTIRTIMKRRYLYMPYLYSLFENAARSGQPVLTPTFFYASGDTATYGQDTDYLFGPNLLVAPVYIAGATTRQIYLPGGSRWVDVRNDAVFDGGQTVTVAAPLGDTPVFAREGTVLPLGPTMANVDAAVPPDIHIDVYSGAAGQFVLYEDDGKSFDYRRGIYRYTQLSYTELAAARQFTIDPLGGTYILPSRNWTVAVHRVSRSPTSVTADATVIAPASSAIDLATRSTAWFYDTGKGVLTIKIPDRGKSVVGIQ